MSLLRSASRPFALPMVALAFLVLPRLAAAQIPDEFKNLKVLPEDISKRDLVEAMHEFSSALDVRCLHCHKGEEGRPFSEWDFASDAKPAKITAREMMRMTRAINEEWLKGLERREDPAVAVRCNTCHAGREVPRELPGEMMLAWEKGGAETAEARYRELRGELLGRGAYDFGPRAIGEVVERLNEKGDEAGVGRMVDLAIEFYPESAEAWSLRAAVLQDRGEKDAAISAWERVLELAPESWRARRALEGLRGPEGGEEADR